MSTQDLLVDRDDSILRVTFNRPDRRNALTFAMYDGLHAHLTIARLHRAASSWQSRLDLEHAEHEQIVEALCNRDAKALQSALRKHIGRAKRELVNQLLEQ